MQELVVAGRSGVVVCDIEISLRVVFIHVVVPVHGIQATDESAIDEWQFPVFPVVNLSTSRNNES
jgi:hypothetical protein